MKDIFFCFPISSSTGGTTRVPMSQQHQFTWSFRALTQAKHMVPFYPIWISNTQFDWRDCQMMTGRGHFINTVFSSSMYLLTPLNGLAPLTHLLFQATSRRPNCLGCGCDLSPFPCICAQATNRSQNCFSRSVFLCPSHARPNQRRLLPCPCRLVS